MQLGSCVPRNGTTVAAKLKAGIKRIMAIGATTNHNFILKKASSLSSPAGTKNRSYVCILQDRVSCSWIKWQF